jgi:hypothetical protein
MEEEEAASPRLDIVMFAIDIEIGECRDSR